MLKLFAGSHSAKKVKAFIAGILNCSEVFPARACGTGLDFLKLLLHRAFFILGAYLQSLRYFAILSLENLDTVLSAGKLICHSLSQAKPSQARKKSLS